MTGGDPKTDREFQVWEHGRQCGLAEGTRAVLRYILAHGWEVSLGEIAKATGLRVERVAEVLDDIRRQRALDVLAQEAQDNGFYELPSAIPACRT